MIETILDFVQTNLVSMGVSTGTIAIVVVLIKQVIGLLNIYKSNIIAGIKANIYKAVTEAEVSKTVAGLGRFRKCTVYAQVMGSVSGIANLFFTKEELNDWIEEIVINVKVMLGTMTEEEAKAAITKLSEIKYGVVTPVVTSSAVDTAAIATAVAKILADKAVADAVSATATTI